MGPAPGGCRDDGGELEILCVCNESVNFPLENSESLLEFPTISRWLHWFVADSLRKRRVDAHDGTMMVETRGGVVEMGRDGTVMVEMR